MNIFKKYWWVITVVAVVVIYFVYRGMSMSSGTSSYVYNAAPSMTSGPVVQTPQTSSVPTVSNNIYSTQTDPTKGNYLADFQGMSLYVFDNDLASGTSTCYGTCATKWFAYSSGATAESNLPANITVITRTDGTKQFAWMGRPLYHYYLDQNVGDVLGDGVGGIWHLVTP